MSGHTMVAIPVARQMTPSTTNSHQFFAMDGTSLIMAGDARRARDEVASSGVGDGRAAPSGGSARVG